MDSDRRNAIVRLKLYKTHGNFRSYMSSSSRIQELAAEAVRMADRTLQAYPANPYRGGDPSCWYHELRNFLLRKGIDTRVFTFGSIPLPSAIGSPHITDRMGTLDNSFFFELRKLTSIEAETKLNTLVLLGRVFFSNDQCSNEFHVQFVPNHYGDCIGQLNTVYSDVIDFFQNEQDQWEEPAINSSNRVIFFEKTFTNLYTFQSLIVRFLDRMKAHDLKGGNILDFTS